MKVNGKRVFSFRLTGTIPSKKNRYQIRHSRVFWSAVGPIVGKLKALNQRTEWIGPGPGIEEFEQLVGWTAKGCFHGEQLTGKLKIEIRYSGRADLDNVCGCIFDGLQKSGVIKNDRQFDKVVVVRIPSEGYGAEIRISEL